MAANEPDPLDYGHPTINGPSTDPGERNGDGLRRYVTEGSSVMISMDDLEKLYLSPPHKVKGNLRQAFANPTPL